MAWRISIWLFWLLQSAVSAQDFSNDSNHYELFRHRFHSLFLRQSPGPGYGLPVARIRLGTSCTHAYWFDEACGGQGKVPGARNIFEFEDATAHLGFRMLLLGLEFHGNWNPQRAQSELTECLNTIDRLDSLAGAWYGTSTQLDGFILRDDALISAAWPDTAGCMRSGWTCRKRPGLGNLMSQDQMVYLSLGYFSWLAKPTWFPERERLTKQWQRLLLRLTSNEWVIKDPLGKQVHIGGWMLPGALPLRKAALRKKVDLPFDFQTEMLGRWLWYAWQLPDMSKNPPLHHEVNRCMQLALASLDARFPKAKMQRFAQKADLEFYALLWWLWHETEPLPHNLQQKQQELSQGLWSPPQWKVPGHTNPPPGWRCENRWLHPDRKPGVEWEENCLFNGLDRLLWWQLTHQLKKRN